MDKINCQHGTGQRQICRLPVHAASYSRIKAGCGMEKAAGRASGPVKKTGAPEAVFRCLFRPMHTACFLAARGKAAGMLTLRELKNMAETAPSGQKTPTARELRSSGKLIAGRKIGESAEIAAYRNGYAVYYAGRDATVFRIHACSGYCYDSGSSPCSIGGGIFDGEAWYLRLVLEGEDRLFRNLASREQGWSVSYSAASEEWGGLYSGCSGAESALDGIIREETMQSLLSVLTERQRRAAVLFYLEQKTERQIAEELGITASAISRILAKSLARMRAGIRRDTVPAGNGTA